MFFHNGCIFNRFRNFVAIFIKLILNKKDSAVLTVDKVTVLSRKTTLTPLHIRLLHEELERRSRLNPQYSLRSFAKQLGLDPSLLSKSLKLQRKLSPENAKKILNRCQFNLNDKKLFWQSFLQERHEEFSFYDEDSGKLRDLSSPIQENLIQHDAFHLISEPHHYVLAELVRTKNFRSDIKWISKQLQLPILETEASLHRLVRVGILTKEGTQYVRTRGRFTTADKSTTDSALKRHQRKLLDASAEALDKVPLEARTHQGMTIAIDPKKIPIAQKMIQDFLNQLSSVLETGNLEEVYQMSFSLFPANSDQARKANE